MEYLSSIQQRNEIEMARSKANIFVVGPKFFLYHSLAHEHEA